jgi:hypothetical protein
MTMIEAAFVVILTAAFAGTVETTVAVIVAAAFTGAVAGAFTARAYLRRAQRRQVDTQPVRLADPMLNAEIERAAGAWAEAQGRPEATGLVAEKFRLVHDIGRQRGWWQ